MDRFEIQDLEPIIIDFKEPQCSTSGTNFGSGIELLMNDKVKHSSNSNSVTINMGELDDLENELNELSGTKPSSNSNSTNKSIGGFTSDFFGFGSNSNSNSNSNSDSNNIKININDEPSNSNLGHATVESIGNSKTWDGFSKLTPDIPNVFRPPTQLDEREKRRKKRAMIKSLEQWSEKGFIKTYSNFNMDSNFEEVEDEYESALEDKRKRDSVKIQQNWLITMVNTIEYGNAMFDPFNISLDGWGESISEDIDSYGEIFEQLHDKYKGGKMSPELTLLLRLGFSASVIHCSNKALSTATPGFNDIIKQSPELMRMFTNATVDSMKQTAPSMSFASELLNQNRTTGPRGPPPTPVETRNMVPPQRPGAMQFTPSASNRPDIDMGRGLNESGIDINNNTSFIQMNVQPQQQQPRSTRPEMTGPKSTDIDSILSGLKTTVSKPYTEDDSMISISSLKEMKNTSLPRKSSNRRNKSDKNVISLDI
jgi:hypothetical protein